jgi:hypothetical protein
MEWSRGEERYFQLWHRTLSVATSSSGNCHWLLKGTRATEDRAGTKESESRQTHRTVRFAIHSNPGANLSIIPKKGSVSRRASVILVAICSYYSEPLARGNHDPIALPAGFPEPGLNDSRISHMRRQTAFYSFSRT